MASVIAGGQRPTLRSTLPQRYNLSSLGSEPDGKGRNAGTRAASTPRRTILGAVKAFVARLIAAVISSFRPVAPTSRPVRVKAVENEMVRALRIARQLGVRMEKMPWYAGVTVRRNSNGYRIRVSIKPGWDFASVLNAYSCEGITVYPARAK